MLNEHELKYWVAFSQIPGIGRVRVLQLCQHFGQLEAAWKASAAQLKQAGIEGKLADAIQEFRRNIAPDREIENLHRCQVNALTCLDSRYPARLREIYDYPPVLFVRGHGWQADGCSLAIVGTRRVSIYGRQVTEELVRDLVRSGVIIVSGLARGVDSVAHRTAVDAGGKTFAVFGCGLDVVYPSENARLAQVIMEHGALISEYPLGTRPKADNFPRRNRIMSGVSLGVLVIEAAETSGALITAAQALEQNREVFAVPGSILSPSSRGTNRLIQRGEAKLVLTADDILEELNLSAMAQQLQMKDFVATDPKEAALLKELGAEPIGVDEICRRTGLPAATVTSTLTVLELRGVVKQFGTLNFALSKETREQIQNSSK